MADPSPRAAVVASLVGPLSRAIAPLGDAVAAWVAHEAIGRLLGLEEDAARRSEHDRLVRGAPVRTYRVG